MIGSLSRTRGDGHSWSEMWQDGKAQRLGSGLPDEQEPADQQQNKVETLSHAAARTQLTVGGSTVMHACPRLCNVDMLCCVLVAVRTF